MRNHTARTRFRDRSLRSLFIALLLVCLPTPAAAKGGAELERSEPLTEEVTDSAEGVLRSVYVPGVLADQVVSQPAHNAAFVSSAENTLTQFSLASEHGSIGLLAHNYLAGRSFSHLEQGHIVNLVYDDGRVEHFIVTRILRLQALEPDDIKGSFIDLESGRIFTAAGLFLGTYGQPGRLILQTCIERDGNLSWGRLFVIAEPYDGNVDHPDDQDLFSEN